MSPRDPEFRSPPHPADRHGRWSRVLWIALVVAAAVACWLVIGWAVSRAAAS